MSQVITFEDYTPSPRYDDLPWTEARIEEGDSSSGPWSQIDVIALDPLDADPSNPASRDFTTENADDAFGLWYRIIFADATGDTLQPTEPVQNAPTTSHNYITREHLKRTLMLSGLSFADEDIDVSIAAASRAVDDITNRRFWADSTETTRLYSARTSRIEIDDVFDVTEVASGLTAPYPVLTADVDYALSPLNAPLDNKPYECVYFLSDYERYTVAPLFVPYPYLSVTGFFGWPSVPAGVTAATTILATRILRRQREAPFGILTVGIESGAIARIGRGDPEVQMALCNLIKPRVLIS